MILNFINKNDNEKDKFIMDGDLPAFEFGKGVGTTATSCNS
jgi:hypothetical protein